MTITNYRDHGNQGQPDEPFGSANQALSAYHRATIARRAFAATAIAFAAVVLAACGSDGATVTGRPIAATSVTAPPGNGGDEANRGPTADVDIDPPDAEPTRTFPPGGPQPCQAGHDFPLCFPKAEVSVASIYADLKRRSWDCYRDGQKNDADLEVSDTFECEGDQGKAGKVTLHHSISGNVYSSNRTGPLEEIRVSATTAEIGSGNGTEPTDKDVQKHSVRAFTFMLKRIWATKHPDWAKEAAATFKKMQPNCRTLEPLDNGESPPTADLANGYRISCTNPIGFDVEGRATITQSATLQPPFDNTAPK